MAADTYSSFLGVILEGTGNNNNNWGAILNSSALVILEKAIAGNVAHAVTGGSLDLSTSPPPAGPTAALEFLQNFTGVLTSNQTVVMPNLSKSWYITNNTTGAFQLLIKTTSGTAVNVPQGAGRLVICDGANGMWRGDKDEVGKFVHSARASVAPGELACNGASLLRADYPDLFAAIGTTWGAADGVHFTLPLLTDTGRFLRSSTGSVSVGTYQSNQNLAHTHTAATSAITGTTDNPGNHTHSNSLSDPGHTHNIAMQGDAGVVAGSTGLRQGTGPSGTASSTTGIGITNAAAGGHTHSVTGTAAAQVLASSGGTEARPEAAVALMCIKY